MNLSVSDDNDIAIVDGSIPLVEGLDEIAQKSKLSLLNAKGDWFLNLEQGLPFFETIFKKSTSLAQVEAIYLREISNIAGVLDILKFNIEVDKATRKLFVTFTARTSDGVLDFTGETI